MEIPRLLLGLLCAWVLLPCALNAQTPPVVTGAAGIRLVRIPPGTFRMGAEDEPWERPVRQVTLSRAFFLGVYPVTQGEWRAVMGDNPSRGTLDDRRPVEHVSWNEARRFLRRLNELDPSRFYRLPTEAEWEYACRAGTTGGTYGPLGDIAWYGKNNSSSAPEGYGTKPVGLKQPNAFGLYDMLGNVQQWCRDRWADSYGEPGPVTDPQGPSTGNTRVVRGSYYDEYNERHCWASHRQEWEEVVGLRVAAEPRAPIREEPPERTGPGVAGLTFQSVAGTFLLGTSPVTQRQWQSVMGDNPSDFLGDDQRPVEMVSWEEIQAFLQRLDRRNPRFHYRLPTEAEWEQACRAGGAEPPAEAGWHKGNSGGASHQVGELQPNAFGLHDMTGNVRIWCQDAFGKGRAVRGGSWNDEAGSGLARTSMDPASFSNQVGFRVVAVPGGSAPEPVLAESRLALDMVFCTVPPGSFYMGNGRALDEKPRRRVEISRSFLLGKYPVTQAQWAALMGDNPSFDQSDPALPVEHVSWEDAQRFIQKLNGTSESHTYRLPTEAEWEYACRAGAEGERYLVGSDGLYGLLEELAWYGGNSEGRSHPVGLKAPNAFGLCDMLGNVLQWCQDAYRTAEYQLRTVQVDPRGPDQGQLRVLRGGSWGDHWSDCRPGRRFSGTPDARIYESGFRLVAERKEKP